VISLELRISKENDEYLGKSFPFEKKSQWKKRYRERKKIVKAGDFFR